MRLTTFILLLSLVSTSFLPIFAQKTRAQWIVSDPPHTAVTTAEATRKSVKDVLDAAARIAAQIAIQKIINSTVSWAQSGFEGNPAYVTNPKQYFADIANGVAGEFIAGSDLKALCSPFQAQIRLALRTQYLQEKQFQCTFTEALGNLENFYNDFSEGGWDAWFAMTQNSSNNPYGAFLDAQLELDSRISEKLALETQQLNVNQNFLNWSECTKVNPPALLTENDPDYDLFNSGDQRNPRHVPGKAAGECVERGPTKTPGSVIKANLDKVLPAGLDRLINVQQADQLIEAFAVGILQRYVFGSQGLFRQGNAPSVGTAANASSVYPPLNIQDTNLSSTEARTDRPPFAENSVTPPASSPTPTLPPSGQVSVSTSVTSGTAPLNNVALTAANGDSGQFYYYFFCDRSQNDTPPPIPAGYNNTPVLVDNNIYTDPVKCSYP